MKTKIFLLSVCASLFMLSSCSHGPSAETKAKVAALDSAWTAMGNTAAALSDSLNAASVTCENACKAGDGMKCCEHMQAQKDSAMRPCKNDMTAFEEMKKGWFSQKPMWDSLNTRLAELKEKVAGGKGNDAEINASVTELQTALDNGNKSMAEFASKFNETKMLCMKNMESCKSAGWENMKCTDKKCSMEKKAGDTGKKKA
jgi:uncharacterized coiled-coil protein SlyX